jgi:hypothetical protein
MRAFTERECHDTTTLAVYLHGGSTFTGTGAERGNNAYRTVASDVLGYMDSQGLLVKDERGWYHVASGA